MLQKDCTAFQLQFTSNIKDTGSSIPPNPLPRTPEAPTSLPSPPAASFPRRRPPTPATWCGATGHWSARSISAWDPCTAELSASPATSEPSGAALPRRRRSRVADLHATIAALHFYSPPRGGGAEAAPTGPPGPRPAPRGRDLHRGSRLRSAPHPSPSTLRSEHLCLAQMGLKALRSRTPARPVDL